MMKRYKKLLKKTWENEIHLAATNLMVELPVSSRDAAKGSEPASWRAKGQNCAGGWDIFLSIPAINI